MALNLPDGRNGIAAQLGGQAVSQIELRKSLTAKGTLTIAAPFHLQIEITKGNYGVPHPGPVIWEGILPPLPMNIAVNGATFTFRWNERDADGKQVPAGTYYLHFGNAPLLHYVLDGKSGTEQLPIMQAPFPSISGQMNAEKITIS